MSGTLAAFVGATGGAGTTRLCLETAAVLARTGDDVAILDAAFATQGLARHVQGRIDPDVTALLTEERPLEEGVVELPVETSGRVACCPAYAPFERLARAKTPAAAQRFERLLDTAASEYDTVLVDTPPVAANQAIAAVTAADHVVVVTPGTPRGRDTLPRTRDRLADVGVSVDLTVATKTGESTVADLAVPADETTDPTAVPVSDSGNGAFTDSVVAVAEQAVDRSLDVELGGNLLGL